MPAKPVHQADTVTRALPLSTDMVTLKNEVLFLAWEELDHARALVSHLYGCVVGTLDCEAAKRPRPWLDDDDAPRLVIAADLRAWQAILFDALEHLELAEAQVRTPGEPRPVVATSIAKGGR